MRQTSPSDGSIRHRASPRRLIEALRRTIAAERELLMHPRFEYGAAHVMVHARTQLRRIERQRFEH
jgi:hypothetical protein